MESIIITFVQDYVSLHTIILNINIHSTVILAAWDSIDVDAFGSQSDSGISSKNIFGRQIINSTLKYPQPSVLPGTGANFPFDFVINVALPLKRPYPCRNFPPTKVKFNKNVSKVNRWKNLFAVPKHIYKIILATVLLENFLML